LPSRIYWELKNSITPLACSIRKAFDQVNTSNVYFPKNFFGLAAISKK
ncbi:unnamed protein product, partial [Ascophyllum nodosum]